jgi:hypothetical protein
VDCELKLVSRNIACLIEYGYEIETTKDNKKGYWLVNRDFDESELGLLVDSVLSSRYIPEKTCPSPLL